MYWRSRRARVINYIMYTHTRDKQRSLLTFNMLLARAGIDPANVRMLRHQPALLDTSLLIDRYHNCRESLQAWQCIQSRSNAAKLSAPYWATFMGTPDGRTIFEGLYQVRGPEPIPGTAIDPFTGEPFSGGHHYHYDLVASPEFEFYSGRLIIEWGGGPSGKRAWIQRAANLDKPITVLLEQTHEQPFPGYGAFRHRVGQLHQLSPGWIGHLRQAQGVNLLTCPQSGALYVGSASGGDGFWVRWQDYVRDGHGGNDGLKDKDARTFDVSILQVSGSADTPRAIQALEEHWKKKLGTRAFGLNCN